MDPVLSALAAYFIAWLFASAGWQKLNHGDYYREVLNNYIPRIKAFVNPATLLLGSGEMLIAVFLIVPSTRQVAALVAAALLAVYLVAMARQLVQGKGDMDCGCAGPASKQSIGVGLLIRNSLLMMVAGFASLPVIPREMTVVDYVFLLFAICFAVFAYQCFEQLSENRPRLERLRS